MSSETVLSGWLLRATRYAANAQIRTAVRRLKREEEACMQSSSNETTTTTWEQLAPLLDEALTSLGDTDRNVIATRFFENKKAHEIAETMKLNEDAAKKRVSRALEKLRKFFLKRGVDSTAAAIGETISAHSVLTAPEALAQTVTAVAIAKGATASTSTLALIKGALKIMAWTKMKTTVVVGACVLLAAGTATITIYSNHINKPIREVQSEWSAISGDDGQWSWEGNEVEGHSVTGDSIFASSQKYGDVTFSAVVATPNREATLVIRMQDATNGYTIVFSPGHTPGNDGPGFVRLNKVVNANETRLGVYQGPRMATAGKSAKITVVARGPSIQVFLNGANILRAHDTTFMSGYIGFRIYGWGDAPCDATFSEVSFY